MSDLETEKINIPTNGCGQFSNSKTSSDFDAEFNIIRDQLNQMINDFNDEKLNTQQTSSVSKIVHVPKFNIQKEVRVIAETFRIINIKPVRGIVCDEKILINTVPIGDQEIAHQSCEIHNINSNLQDVRDDKLSIEYVHLPNNNDYLSGLLTEKEKSCRMLNKLQLNLLQSYNFLETFQSRIKDKNLYCKISNEQDLTKKLEPGDKRNSNIFICEDISIHIPSVLPYEVPKSKKIASKRFAHPNPDKCYKYKVNENFTKKSIKRKIKPKKSTCLLSCHKEENNFNYSKHFALFTNFMEIHRPELRVVNRESIKKD